MIVLLSACGKKGGYQVGLGTADITPEGQVYIAGNTSPIAAKGVDFPLEAKACVIASGDTKAVFITLDTLKYPVELYEEARAAIEKETGIPGENIMITSSHTHSGPHYSTYDGELTGVMVNAVKDALKDLEPCRLGAAKTEVTGLSHNRRLLVDGEVWNDWMVQMSQPWNFYPSAGSLDPELTLIAAITEEGNIKTVLWNYACHANSGNTGNLSADYPGRVQAYLSEKLGKEIKTLYMTGPSGDVNPSNGTESMGNKLGDAIISCLRDLTYIEDTEMKIENEVFEIPGREDPVFNEEEIAEKWPDQLEGYRSSFESTKKYGSKGSVCYLNAVSFGKTAVIVSNPGELFSSLSLDIKNGSPFAYTLVTEQTNGALGYLPTVKDFELKGYETWFGEHSNLSKQAGEKIAETSVKMTEKLYGTKE